MLLDTSTRNPSLVEMTLFEGLFTLKGESCNLKEKSLYIRVDEPPMTFITFTVTSNNVKVLKCHCYNCTNHDIIAD